MKYIIFYGKPSVPGDRRLWSRDYFDDKGDAEKYRAILMTRFSSKFHYFVEELSPANLKTLSMKEPTVGK